MKTINFNSPHRKKHFEFFNGMNHPHFNITADVDISALIAYLKENHLTVSLSIVYLLSRAANGIPELKWRIRNNQVVEHTTVNPSFTVPTDEADVFSFCTVDYVENAKLFIQNAITIQEKMRTNPSFEDEEHRDDYLFLSAFPWASFTGIQHAMHYHPSDSVPRITWGRFHIREGKTLMPLSVQAHHAVVDGRHLGLYFQKIEEMAGNPKGYFE